jgi:hypothetical protein
MEPRQTEKRSNHKLIAWGKMIYWMTPGSLRFVFTPAKLISLLIQILGVDQWILTGEEISSKQQLTINYFGNKENKNYIANLAFGGLHTENHVGAIWLWQVSKEVRNHDCSLVITELRKGLRMLFQSKGSIYVPQWIEMGVDIPSNISSFLNKDNLKIDLLVGNESLKSDLRKIRRNRLHFIVTKELSEYRRFYENMHVPYIGMVHANRASFVSSRLWLLQNHSKDNDLLLVKKEEEDVGGMLLCCKKNRAKLLVLGVKDGIMKYIEDGAIGALYYFSLCYLHEKGHKRASLGGSRAFLKDGVLMYKKKWHPSIMRPAASGFLLSVMSMTTGVKGFLVNNPFVYLDGANLNGAVFVDTDGPLFEKTLKTVDGTYFLQGLSKLFVYRLREGNRVIPDTVSTRFSDRIQVSHVRDLFGLS